MSQKPSVSQVFGLIKDVIHLGVATIGTGLRITNEASAKARPKIQNAISKVNNFTIEKTENNNQ